MRMLRCVWAQGDRIKNEEIQDDSIRVTFVVDKIIEVRLRWFKHLNKKCKNQVRKYERLAMVSRKELEANRKKALEEVVRQVMT